MISPTIVHFIQMICLYIYMYIYNIPFIFFLHDFHFFIYFPFICFHLSVIFIRFFSPSINYLLSWGFSPDESFRFVSFQWFIYFHAWFILPKWFTRWFFYFIFYIFFLSFFLFFVTGILTRWNVDLHLHVFLTCAHVLVRKRRRRGKKKELKFRKRPWNVRFLCG